MAYLGVHVTLHPPNESAKETRNYKIGFIVCGVLTVALVITQGIRTNRAQQDSDSQIAGLRSDAQAAKTEAEGAKTEVQKESARRQQAEADLAAVATGEAQKLLAIRTKLGALIAEGNEVKDACLKMPQSDQRPCSPKEKEWVARVREYLKSSMESPYLARFDASLAAYVYFVGVTNDNNASASDLIGRVSLLQEFIKETH